MIASPEVKDDEGLLSVMRGPVVYCMEGIDNNGEILDIALSGNDAIVPGPLDNLLHGTVALTATGYTRDSAKTPVRPIPYFMWGNRGRNDMTVWIPYRINSEYSSGRTRKTTRVNTDG